MPRGLGQDFKHWTVDTYGNLCKTNEGVQNMTKTGQSYLLGDGIGVPEPSVRRTVFNEACSLAFNLLHRFIPEANDVGIVHLLGPFDGVDEVAREFRIPSERVSGLTILLHESYLSTIFELLLGTWQHATCIMNAVCKEHTSEHTVVAAYRRICGVEGFCMFSFRHTSNSEK